MGSAVELEQIRLKLVHNLIESLDSQSTEQWNDTWTDQDVFKDHMNAYYQAATLVKDQYHRDKQYYEREDQEQFSRIEKLLRDRQSAKQIA